MPEVSFPGITFLSAEERTNYPLTVSVGDYGDCLGVVAHVVSSVSSDRVCGYMKQALLSIVEAMKQKRGQFSHTLRVVPQAERDLLLQTWNKSPIECQYSNCCIHKLFERQVECNGDAIAVEFEGDVLSYEG